jgi:hypothetical protein
MAKKRTLRMKTYTLVERAVESGLLGGWHRAHKHTQTPTPEQIHEEQLRYVMLDLDEVVQFDEDGL